MNLWTACPATISQRRVAMKVAGLAVAEGPLRGGQLTAEQVPLFFIGPGIGTAAGIGNHRPGSSASAMSIIRLPAAPREIGLLQHSVAG